MLHTKYFSIAHHLLLMLLLVAPVWVVADPAINPSEKHATESLIKKLQSGGFIIYLRHAATDRTQIDRDRNDLSNCQSQRNLSATGREQARIIGEAIRNLGIPIGTVMSSPYCRCQDTAELAFGTSVVSRELRFGVGDDVQQTNQLSASLNTLLSTPPASGTNTVLVSHTANLKEATGIWPQPEGAAYVFEPLPDQGFEYLGRIPPDEWLADVPTATEFAVTSK
jgi:phosphohistidine phosphatase SixA